MRKIIAVALALCAFATEGRAQNAITQEGTVLQNAPMMFRGNNRARQGATVQGAPKGQTVETGDSVVGGRCDYSAPTDDPSGYYRLCLESKTGTIKMDGTKLPTNPNLKLEINGTVYDLPTSAVIVGSDAIVGNNASLKTATGATGKRLTRLGFQMPGDGGLGLYNWSDSNCTAADDGAQTQPTTVTGCWIADFSGTMPTPMLWGATGKGITNDAPAFQAAVNALQGKGKNLYLGPFRYLLTSQVNVTDVLNIVGEGAKMDTYATSCPAGTSAIIVNSNTSAIVLATRYGSVKGICFQMGTAAGLRGAGWAVRSEPPVGSAGRADIIGNSILYPFLGISVTGLPAAQNNGSTIKDNLIVSPVLAGIEIGAQSINAGTPGLTISGNQIACFATVNGVAGTAATAGLLIYDGAPDATLGDGGPYGCDVGTKIVPGANQLVMGAFSGVLGDTSKTAELYISPKAATGSVSGLRFSSFWVSNAAAGNTTDRPIWIENVSGGSVKNVSFLGGQVHSNYSQTSPAITANGATNVLFDGILLFGADPQGIIGEVYDINNSSGVTISGNHISNDHQIGIRLRGASTNVVNITGNSILAGRPMVMDMIPQTATISNNLGITQFCPPLTVANAVTLTDAYECYKTSSAGEIWEINGGWNSREVIIFAGAALTLHNNVPLKGLCRPNLVMVAGDSVKLRYHDPDKCWMSH